MAETLIVVQYTTRRGHEKTTLAAHLFNTASKRSCLRSNVIHALSVRVSFLAGLSFFLSAWAQRAPKSSFLIEQGLVNIADEVL